jgi:hypothetical protein
MKEEMVSEYREFKINKSKHNFRMLQAIEKIQERLLNESLPLDLNLIPAAPVYSSVQNNFTAGLRASNYNANMTSYS